MVNLEKLLEEEEQHTIEQIEAVNKKLFDSRSKKVEALSFGDLSENSAYSEAENSIGLFSYEKVILDDKLKDIEEMKNQEYKTSGYIGLKSYFTAKRNDTGEVLSFFVVSPSLGNASKGLLPIDGKLGQSVLGKKKGDICFVDTGIMTYTVNIIEVI